MTGRGRVIAETSNGFRHCVIVNSFCLWRTVGLELAKRNAVDAKDHIAWRGECMNWVIDKWDQHHRAERRCATWEGRLSLRSHRRTLGNPRSYSAWLPRWSITAATRSTTP